MRFIPDGPDIPEELLIARDRGNVIFFCGAGVSRAFADLPGFEALAKTVIDELGSTSTSPARKLLTKALRMGHMSGVGGLLATDRIFGLLEREFETQDVRAAVGRAVRPLAGSSLKAHRILLDLSRPPNGQARLVTTNFDLLFEDCDRTLLSWGPPLLPDIRNLKKFTGVIHLHGRVDDTYNVPEDEEFVVSSADFGRAYLSDGWATRFIQTLMERYQIVFVGYSADDPPVQYLLEALNLAPGSRQRLYAFQNGLAGDAAALWEHKGVKAIPFDSSNGFDTLWDSLAAWAERSRDAKAWHEATFENAGAGPENSDRHFRGQIADILSTAEGTRALVLSQKPLDGRWLLVLDPQFRYAPPLRVNAFATESPVPVPFQTLGLDCDIEPDPKEPGILSNDTSPPNGVFDAFDILPLDRERINDVVSAPFYGGPLASSSALSPRLASLGIWLNRIAHQPVTLWWASHKNGLHPRIIDHIKSSLSHDSVRFSDGVRRGWRLLFAAWSDRRIDPDAAEFDLAARVEREGWSTELVRNLVDIYRPQIVVQRGYHPAYPAYWAESISDGLISGDVEYPAPNNALVVPNAFLPYAIVLFRSNLELAITLENEVRGGSDLYLEPTRANDGELEVSDEAYGITGPVARFQKLMLRWSHLDSIAAHDETLRWTASDEAVFARLRIWAASQPTLLSDTEAGDLLLALSDKVFWGATHDRDILFALRDRWIGFESAVQVALSDRLRTGNFIWTPDQAKEYERAIIIDRLNRLYWLTLQGIELPFDLESFSAPLRQRVPEWMPNHATEAVRSRATKAYDIETDDSEADLLDVPLREILPRAREAGQFNFGGHMRRDPFRGLAKRRPSRAMKALSVRAKTGEAPKEAWATFLFSDTRKTDSLRLVKVIAGRLAGLPSEQLSQFPSAIANWIDTMAGRLYAEAEGIFVAIWDRVLAVLSENPRNRHLGKRDWADGAVSSPILSLKQALSKDPTIKGLKAKNRLPDRFTYRVDQLLSLPGDYGRFAMNLFATNLGWLYYVDPVWATKSFIPAANRTDDTGNAFWDGFLRAPKVPPIPLYQCLKKGLILRAHVNPSKRHSVNALAGMLLAGWGGDSSKMTFGRLMTNVQFRDLLVEAGNEFRVQVLMTLKRWSAEPDTKWRVKVIPFLQLVWPKQRALRNPAVSSALVNLAMSSGDLLPQISALVLPRLVQSAVTRLSSIVLDVGKPDFAVAKYPVECLDIFWAILPEDSEQWPYQFEKILAIFEEKAETKGDPRLAELRRRIQHNQN